jgi:hypothetical protein
VLARALWNIARIYSDAGEADEALAWFERAWQVKAPEPFKFDAYRALAGPKALALGLDANGKWLYWFFAAEPGEDVAAERAVAECRRQRARFPVDADCRLYALGDRIVWQPTRSRR